MNKLKTSGALVEEDESALLPGEKKILQVAEPVYSFFKGTRSRRAGAEEHLMSITNYRIMLTERQNKTDTNVRDSVGQQVEVPLKKIFTSSQIPLRQTQLTDYYLQHKGSIASFGGDLGNEGC